MASKDLRFKNTGFEVKDMDMKTGQIQLYAAHFDSVDMDGDIFDKGAFAKTIQENGPNGANRIKQLWQHDIWNPIGRPNKMIEDSRGLLVEGYITDTNNGDYRKLYEEKIITEHSVGFFMIDSEVDEVRNANVIKEVRLFEYSAVTWGANENTPVVGMKSMGDQGKEQYLKRLDEQIKNCERVLKNGTLTDETMYQIQFTVHGLKASIKSLLEDSKEPPKPAGTQEPQEPIDLVKLWKELESNN